MVYLVQVALEYTSKNECSADTALFRMLFLLPTSKAYLSGFALPHAQ